MSEKVNTSSLKNQPDLNEVLLYWKGPSHPFKKKE